MCTLGVFVLSEYVFGGCEELQARFCCVLEVVDCFIDSVVISQAADGEVKTA